MTLRQVETNLFYTKNNLKKRNTFYLGFKPEYNNLNTVFNKHTIKDSSETEVAELLINNPVAIFQDRQF